MEADVSFFLHSNCTGELVYGEGFSTSTSLPCELVSQRRIAWLAVEAVSFSSAPTPTNSPASPLGYSVTVGGARVITCYKVLAPSQITKLQDV
jgi:hypothetical protein